MKTIKFTPELTELVKNGSKTTTWRVFDEKDLKEGDRIILATRDEDTVTEFGKATITKVTIRTISTIQEEDYEGHEPSPNPLEDYKKYYGDKVDKDTEVKIVKFKLNKIY